jgi:hypothetical protein
MQAVNGSNRNRIVLVGALGLVVLLAALVLPRVFGGGSESGPGPEASTTGGSTPTTTAPVEELVTAPAPEAFSTKNPFTPLIDPAPAATAPSTGGTGTGSTATGEASDVPASTPSGTGTGTGTGTTGTGDTEPLASGRISLTDVYAGPDGAPVATVQVDGTFVTVREGEAFGDGYLVVSLSQGSRSGVFSRDGQQFTVRAGEQVLK